MKRVFKKIDDLDKGSFEISSWKYQKNYLTLWYIPKRGNGTAKYCIIDKEDVLKLLKELV